MTLTPIECEARLVGLSKQRRKDGDWIEVKFHIHPDDHPAALFILPLGTDCMLSIKGVPEKEDETTTEAPAETERPKGGSKSIAAGRLCNNNVFVNWLFQKEPAKTWLYSDLKNVPYASAAAEIVRRMCGCKESRAELDHNEAAGEIWDQIERDFYASQRGETDEALMEQRR